MVLVLAVIVVGAAIDTVVLSATVMAITITFAKKPAAAPAAPAPATVTAKFVCVILAVPPRLSNDALTRIWRLPETRFIRRHCVTGRTCASVTTASVCAALEEIPSWLWRMKTNTTPAPDF